MCPGWVLRAGPRAAPRARMNHPGLSYSLLYVCLRVYHSGGPAGTRHRRARAPCSKWRVRPVFASQGVDMDPEKVILVVLIQFSALLTTTLSSEGACTTLATEDMVLHVDSFVQPGQTVQRGVQVAINAAIKSAQVNPTALLFGAHEYRLASPNYTAHEPVLQVLNATSRPLRIDGCGASIVVTSPMAGLFSIQNASRLSVGNFTIDYDPLPMTQGFVTAV
eukprot:COSAG02_NODE_21700_length_778_cov_0.905744_1_plen_220_part_01